MQILDLNIGHFGKLEKQRFTFSPGMNIICGGNESGKSTVHAFIRAMLFDIERGRGRGGKPDEYALRQPWENGSYFSGSMRIKSGDKVYRIERSFYKEDKVLKLICETTGRESADPKADLQALLGGIGESTFLNTVFVRQAGTVTEEGLAEELRSCFLNQQTGADASLQVEQALEELRKQKKKLEKEMREKTRDIEEQIRRKKLEKELLMQTAREEIKQMQVQEERVDTYTEAGDIWEVDLDDGIADSGSEREDVSPQKHIVNEEIPTKDFGTRAGNLSLYTFYVIAQVLLIITALLAIGCMAVLKQWEAKVLMLAGALLAGVVFALLEIKKRKMQQKTDPADTEEKEARKQEKPVSDEANLVKKQVLQGLRRQKQSRNRQQEAQLDAEIRELYQKMDQTAGQKMMDQLAALDLAMGRIQELSEEIYEEQGSLFAQQTSRILSEITGGRYNAIAMDEHMQVRINTPEKLLYPWQVSFGTMQQIYFALRMAAGRTLLNEPLPVILDEPFACYDDARLKRMMRFLQREKRQIILFTCQKRESDIYNQIMQA